MNQINITLFGEMLIFAVLVFVTMKYIVPPILKAIEERQKKIIEGLSSAKTGIKCLHRSRQQSLKIITQAQKTARTIIERSTINANKIIEQSKKNAETEKNKILNLTKIEIEMEKKKALIDIQQQSTKLALLIAKKFLITNQTTIDNQHLINLAINELQNMDTQ